MFHLRSLLSQIPSGKISVVSCPLASQLTGVVVETIACCPACASFGSFWMCNVGCTKYVMLGHNMPCVLLCCLVLPAVRAHLSLHTPRPQTSVVCCTGAACDSDTAGTITTEVAKNPGPRIVYPTVSSLPRIYRSVANPPSSSFPHQPRAPAMGEPVPCYACFHL